eukprot:Platyproteum_vivax@DN6528_c1_g1_i1.p1
MSTARSPKIEIHYCVGCKWMMRAAWMVQELLSTFSGEIAEAALVPNRDEPGGTFNVYLDGQLIFSRKEQGRFPEMKELKQLVRDVVKPEKTLGHSDKKE